KNEEPIQPINSKVPDEQIPEDPVEEVVEEEALEESDKVIDPSNEEIGEPDDTVTELIEEAKQIKSGEEVIDDQLNN
ncbi:MAG: hypothetical protein ABS896_09560, partial [Carnobacterium inhibens]|uniref:hypothetical protein n=1 Tax=Carnobacterium inhibens TaxID=147709 RepID=UPI003314CAFE